MIYKIVLRILIIFLIVSCDKQKDDETTCMAPDIQENIIGNWHAALESDLEDSSILEFRKDGICKENGDLFFGNYNSPVVSWKITNDSLVLNAKFSNSTSSSYSFVIINNQCNEVTLGLDGLEQVKLTRK